MENLTKVSARLLLIHESALRRANQVRSEPGPYWRDVLWDYILTARRLNSATPYYNRAAAFD